MGLWEAVKSNCKLPKIDFTKVKIVLPPSLDFSIDRSLKITQDWTSSSNASSISVSTKNELVSNEFAVSTVVIKKTTSVSKKVICALMDFKIRQQM